MYNPFVVASTPLKVEVRRVEARRGEVRCQESKEGEEGRGREWPVKKKCFSSMHTVKG